MNRTKKNILIIVVIFILLFAYTRYIHVFRAKSTAAQQSAISRIMKVDHAVLRDACREMIHSRRTFGNDVFIMGGSNLLHVYGDTIVLSPEVSPLEGRIPLVLQSLSPIKIEINTTEIYVWLKYRPDLVVLKGSLEDVCDGSVRLTNGLSIELDKYVETH